jgi:nitroreductase
LKDEFLNLIKKNRSFRRFYEDEKIEKQTLKDLVDLARLSPSGGNQQPFKFFISNSPQTNQKIFATLAWAGYLKDWDGPGPGERPSAYIVILGDNTIRKSILCDHGIAAQSIMLGAVSMGLGGCMLGSIKRGELKAVLNLEDKYEVLLVLALGKPKEKVVLEDIKADGDIKYYRDKENVHHVPKRLLDDIIIE